MVSSEAGGPQLSSEGSEEIMSASDIGDMMMRLCCVIAGGCRAATGAIQLPQFSRFFGGVSFAKGKSWRRERSLGGSSAPSATIL